MKHLSTIVPVLALATTIGLTGCVSPRGPSAAPNNVPPRLVSGGYGISNDEYRCGTLPTSAASKPSAPTIPAYSCKADPGSSVSWDHPEYFGPVPADLKAKGQAACNTLKDSDWVATGYHPSAQFADGTTSTTGGYFCERRKQRERG